MEVFNTPVVKSPLSSSPFITKFSLQTYKLKNPYRYQLPLFKFHRTPISPYVSPLRVGRNVSVSAHFGRATSRRNSLRKKLINDQKVRENPLNLDPGSHSHDSNLNSDDRENLNYSSIENSNLDSGPVYDGDLVELSNAKELKSKLNLKSNTVSESALLSDLENWVDQYRKETEFWGIGSNPIFSVFLDLDGNVERVKVNEDEISRRSQVVNDLDGNSKILYAKKLAKQMENGEKVISRNSSVAKFVTSSRESGYVNPIHGLIFHPEFIPKLSVVGRTVACGFVLFWVAKKVFSFRIKEVHYTESEKEMMRRKIESRRKKDLLDKGSVEVVEEALKPSMVSFEKPKLDKEELLSSILKAKATKSENTPLELTRTPREGCSFDEKISEIQEMARRAREIEKEGGEEKQDVNKGQLDDELKDDVSSRNNVRSVDVEGGRGNGRAATNKEVDGDNGVIQASSFSKGQERTSLDLIDSVSVSFSIVHKEAMQSSNTEIDESYMKINEVPSVDIGEGGINGRSVTNKEVEGDNGVSMLSPVVNKEATQSSNTVIDESYSYMKKNESCRNKPRVILSVKEAREFLSRKRDKKELDRESVDERGKSLDLQEPGRFTGKVVDHNNKLSLPAIADEASGSTPILDSRKKSSLNDKKDDLKDSDEGYDGGVRQQSFPAIADGASESTPILDSRRKSSLNDKETILIKEDDLKESDEGYDEGVRQQSFPAIADGASGSTPILDSRKKSSLNDKETILFNKDDLKGSDEGYDAGVRQQSFPAIADGASGSIPSLDSRKKSSLNEKETILIKKDDLSDEGYDAGVRQPPFPAIATGPDSHKKSSQNDKETILIKNDHPKGSEEGYDESTGDTPETIPPVKIIENWMEKNFHEVEPTLKRMGDGFRDNYMAAREKVSQKPVMNVDISQLAIDGDESEFEWMKDDKLTEIVFQVRENELAGRDPFYLMDAEDKRAFFKGLEKKVEKENEKLAPLHEWLHSNIENLDYGADGISLYDPPEKFVPRWKGPPLEKSPEFIDNYLEQRKALFAEKADASFTAKKEDEQNFLQKSAESQANNNVATSPVDDNDSKKLNGKSSKSPKIVIEGSDGSLRSGTKSGKEYWQHTKKWSRGFLESYNAETDPEVKSVMKDIGKDLDRWITEEEIQEAGDLMDKLPEGNKKFIEKKLGKLKREMEMFGPAAVVSKYREYADDKEEDYLWWLDLPHVLCLEIYTVDNGEPRMGFYALEMAGDLELEPKPHHVIAFQDAHDCKNLCYIIQAHLEMLGNGNAFVVPRTPKDAFREAKANGFGVTVIRKGELQLNVDQPLEEVEEQICEIGSKMYHDKIMGERSVDMSSLMKGVYGFNAKTIKRRSKKKKRMLKRSKKQG